MTNAAKLRGRMIESGYTLAEMADELSITRPTLQSRLAGRSEFRANEIKIMCYLLGIDLGELEDYFFADDVPKTGTRRNAAAVQP